MEKNNEKDLQAYIRPETEIVTIGGDSTVMQSIDPTSDPTVKPF